MRAISLWEPWASLMMTGAKTIETRSWKTSYRGDLLICASKKGLEKDELRKIINDPVFRKGLKKLGNTYFSPIDEIMPLSYEVLNFGKAICVVNLRDIFPTQEITRFRKSEKEFGDYSDGRWGWFTQNLRQIKQFEIPPEIKGRQRLFEVPDSLIKYKNKKSIN